MLLDKLNLEAVQFASTDETRPSINGLHIMPDYTEATNGHILIRVPTTDTSEDDFPSIPDYEGGNKAQAPGVIIPADAVKSIAKRIPTGKRANYLPILENVSLRFNGDSTLKAATTDLDSPVVSTVKLIDAPYPNTDQILVKDSPDRQRIAFAPDILLTLAKFAKKAGANSIQLSIGESTTATTFSIKADCGRTVTGLIMPCRITE